MSDGLAMSALLPLYPRKQTFVVRAGMSQMGQQVTFEGKGQPTEAASIQMREELLDDLAQTFRVFFDDLARLL
jgi:hypothetical protein